VTTVREILLAGGRKDLRLVHEGEQTEGRVSISCQFFQFENSSTSFSNSNHKGDGLLCGLATVLIASASGIKGQRDQLTPSVVVTWGTIGKILPYLRCMLILCPFVFRFEASLPSAFKFTLMSGEKELGTVDVPLTEVQNAPDGILQSTFATGDGASIKASICIRGIAPATMEESPLPVRSK